MLSKYSGGWILAGGFLGITACIVIGNQIRNESGEPGSGLTTEIAMLLMYAVGVSLALLPEIVGVAVGAGVAVLLQFKPELHGIAQRLSDDDTKAIMRFVLLAFIVLPVLPNRPYGPFDVLNPHDIWKMVVLIVGISLGGYIVYKFFGENAGVVVGGILGGTISSTATAVSYARRVKESPGIEHLAALVICIASTIVYIRVLIELSVVAPQFVPVAAPRIAVLFGVSVLVCLGLWLKVRGQKSEMPEQENPSELKPALVFGLLYAAVLFGVAAAKHYFGNQGLFLLAGISGLTDMDAITLSTGRMVAQGTLNEKAAWQMILLAGMSNLLFKAGLVFSLGNRKLFGYVAMNFGLCILAGVLVVFFA
jgi:uncharacterized membrane protein (DUF4010 family)